MKTIQTARISLEARAELTVHGARGSHQRSDFVLIRIIAESPEGRTVEGFGEVSATPLWSGEDGGSAEHFIDDILKPILIGRPLAPVGSLETLMDRALAGNVFTKAGLAMALWDCWAKILDVPLAVALGGPYRRDVPIKMSLSGNGPELGRCFKAVSANGVRAYKVKVGLGIQDDVARVAYARDLAGPDALIGVDANGGWSRAEAIAAVTALRPYQIAFVEQPCAPHDLAGLRETRALGIPVIADESVFTARDLVQVIKQDAADIISIYVGKAGGPARAVEQGQLAAAFGLDCVIGSNGEFGIGAAAQLHVACAIQGLAEAVPSDVIGALYYSEDILENPLQTDGVRVRLGDGAGLGVRPREDVMELFR